MCGTAFPQVPQHVAVRFLFVHTTCVRKGARNYLPLSKHEWHIWKPRPWQPARHVLQMSVSAWFGRNLDHGGAGGGGAQEVGGARVGVLTQPGLEGADPGQRSSNLKKRHQIQNNNNNNNNNNMFGKKVFICLMLINKTKFLRKSETKKFCRRWWYKEHCMGMRGKGYEDEEICIQGKHHRS